MPFIRFQHRRDIASEWVTNNPLLAIGEMGLETDTSQFKIGNGINVWNGLPYAAKGPTGPTGGTTFSGPTGSVLFSPDGTSVTGSSIMTFNPNTGYTGLPPGMLNITGNLKVSGGIDPVFLQLTATSSNPYPSGVGVLWYNSLLNSLMVDNLTLNTTSGPTSGLVTTFAGLAGLPGTNDGQGSSARFELPSGSVIDLLDNLYVCDSDSSRIRKITPAGVVTTIAGSTPGYADGVGTAAQFDNPKGITIDSSGNLYVSDSGNNLIRKITPAGVVTTFAGSTSGNADGLGTAAQFNGPDSITIDSSGNLYLCDVNNHRIRKITPAGVVTTIAGSTDGYADGVGTAAQFSYPEGIAIDLDGNLYVSDSSNHRIRKITPAGVVTTIAGSTSGYADGVGNAAQFNNPIGIIVDSLRNLYVSDAANHRIRKITPDGVVTTISGVYQGYLDGPLSTSEFNVPGDITIDSSGNLYVSDVFNYVIRKITLGTGAVGAGSTGPVVSTIAGSTQGYADGVGTAAQFSNPEGITIDSSSNLYVADTLNNRIRKITPAGVVTTFAGGTVGNADGVGNAAQFNGPFGITIDSSGNFYVCDTSNHRIRKITPAGVVTTFAGSTQGYLDGLGTAAQFNAPGGIVFDSSGNLYVCDSDNNRIRKITPAGVVTTFAGGTVGNADGVGSSAKFVEPVGIIIDSSSNLYVCDTGNSRIRKITPLAVVTTIAGSTSGYADGVGTSAQFRNPQGITIDSSGNLYVSDAGNNRIRKITPGGVVTTIAGSIYGYADGQGIAAYFKDPSGIVIDSSGNFYVCDRSNYRIRKITLV